MQSPRGKGHQTQLLCFLFLVDKGYSCKPSISEAVDSICDVCFRLVYEQAHQHSSPNMLMCLLDALLRHVSGQMEFCNPLVVCAVRRK
jgi:hypothetical protein